MLDTFRQKDKERILRFIEEAEINFDKLSEILTRFNLSGKYKSLGL
jgi:hypothetical protein